MFIVWKIYGYIMLHRNVQLRRQFDFIYITKIILEGTNAIQYGDSGHNNSG